MQGIGHARFPSLSERVWTTELADHIGERVRIAGWLHRYRQLGQVSFLVLRDARGLAQVVVDEPELESQLGALGHESVLVVEGEVVAMPQAPRGVELHAPAVDVVVPVHEQIPFDLFRPEIAAQLPTVLDHATVGNRHPSRRAYFALAAALLTGFRETLEGLGFTEIQTPKLVGSATESGANVFTMDYFGRPAYLAQSPQFYKQMMVGVYERVYEAGPVFRAEPHDTSRHLNEYVSLDAEMGFIEDHTTVMAVLRDVMAGMVAALHERASDALEILKVTPPEVPAEIPAVHFADAQQMISEATGEDVSQEPDLAPAHERWLGEWAQREHGSDWVFVTGYPMVKRPFYTHPDPARPEYSNSFDLLFRGLELVTGGQRLHRYQDYLAAAAKAGVNPESIEGYLEAFRFGMPPHGGFAIGLERWVAQLVGINNVREVTLFPRTMTRLEP